MAILRGALLCVGLLACGALAKAPVQGAGQELACGISGCRLGTEIACAGSGCRASHPSVELACSSGQCRAPTREVSPCGGSNCRVKDSIEMACIGSGCRSEADRPAIAAIRI